MERKRIEISALLHARHKKIYIAKLQNVRLSTVKQVTNYLKNNKSLKDRLCSGIPQVFQQENVRKAFLKDLTLKMTEFVKKKI